MRTPVGYSDPETPEERETETLVKELRATRNLHPLITMLRRGEGGPERARDALLMLGELDLELLVQVALDTLIDGFVEDPELVHQPRRQVHGDDSGPDPS
jgi:hypothetical protein